ncbi:MAG: BatA domain-containing protein, partial [Elusimicrobia bacterium]|nr:BatA domain-containing protein [Candidatus Obscuribacterium magneticum]
MTFLSPLFLWFLPFLALPVIIHLLHKRNPQRIHFSYLKFIRQADQTLMPRKKLKDLILL